VTLLEKLVDLGRREGASRAVVRDGSVLAELYQEQGLSRKLVGLLEELAGLAPDSFELERRLAHARAGSGDRSGALAGLLRRAREAVAKERYPTARLAFVEVLELDPEHREAAAAVEAIDQDLYAQRRQRRRKLGTRCAILAAVLFLSTFSVRESRARVDYSQALSSIAVDELLEHGDYAEARLRLERIAENHPWTTTTLYDLTRRIEDLERLEDRHGAGFGSSGPDRMPPDETATGESARAGQDAGHDGGRSAE
jgi:tetratricopeptide (TPR) repeat protein